MSSNEISYPGMNLVFSSTEEEFRIFDSLPSEIRVLWNDALLDISAGQILQLFNDYSFIGGRQYAINVIKTVFNCTNKHSQKCHWEHMNSLLPSSC